jgi:hypothetical protein
MILTSIGIHVFHAYIEELAVLIFYARQVHVLNYQLEEKKHVKYAFKIRYLVQMVIR